MSRSEFYLVVLLIGTISIALLPEEIRAQRSIGGPYTVDSATVLLMHFDDTLDINSDYQVGEAQPHGSWSFIQAGEREGTLNQQLYLDNDESSDTTFINVPDTTALDLTGSWTMELWVNVRSYGDTQDDWRRQPRLVFKPGEQEAWCPCASNYFLDLFGDKQVFQTGYYVSGTGWTQIQSAENLVPAGDWYHLTYIRDTARNVIIQMINQTSDKAITDDASELELKYFDAKAYDPSSEDPPRVSDAPLWIGHSPQKDTSEFALDGFMDELRISNIVRDFRMPPAITSLDSVDTVSPNESVTISSKVFGIKANRVDSVKLHYRVNKSGWDTLGMQASTGDNYTATIPGQTDGDTVDYFVSSISEAGYTSYKPAAAPVNSVYHTYHVVHEANPFYAGPASGAIDGGQSINTSNISSAQKQKRPKEPTFIPEHEYELQPTPDDVPPPLPSNRVQKVEDRIGKFKQQSADSINILKNFDGIGYTGFIPPDPIMAAGPDHIVACVNTDFAIYGKNGSHVKTINATDWFENVLPERHIAFDPKVVYDHFEERFVMVWLAVDGSTNSAWYLISVSDDSDPRGTWFNYALPSDVNGSTEVDNWGDYEGLGFNKKAFYITSNQFGFSNNPGYKYVKLRILGKQQFYDNQADSVFWTDFWNLREPSDTTRVFTVRPAVEFSNEDTEYMLNASPYVKGTFLTLWKLKNPLSSPSLEVSNVPTAEYYYPPEAEQKGSIERIDVGGSRLRNVVYRDGKLRTIHSIAATSNRDFAKIHYVGIDAGSGSAFIDNIYGRNGFYYYYPAVAADSTGDAYVVFNRSSDTTYAGIRITGKKSGESTLRTSRSLKRGQNSYVLKDNFDRNRWGDYSGIAVDPVNPDRVWVNAEYASSIENRWATRIGQLSMESMGLFVWPGDTDNDGDVNQSDVLPIGLHWKDKGPARDSASKTWEAQLVKPWDPEAATFADADGSGTVEQGDVLPVGLNWGKTHDTTSSGIKRKPHMVHYTSTNDRGILTFEKSRDDDNSYVLKIAAQDWKDVLGTAFEVEYPADHVKVISMELTSWLGDDNIAQSNVNEKEGKISIGVTRKATRQSKSGSGVLAEISYQLKGEPKRSSDSKFRLQNGMLSTTDAGYISVERATATQIEKDKSDIPDQYSLDQNYPNPFNPNTVIPFDLPEKSKVSMEIYSVLGKKVATLVDRQLKAGHHTVKFNADNLPSGIYFYKLKTPEYTRIRKMSLVK